MKLTDKKLNTGSILLITIICPVIVIFLSSIAIFLTAKTVQPQDSVDPSFFENIKYTIPAEPKNEEDALTLMSKLFSAAVKSGDLKYSKSTSAHISDIICGNESVQAFFGFMKGSLQDKFSGFFEGASTKYGEDASPLLAVLPGSTPSEISSEISGDTLTLSLKYNTVFNNMYFLSDDTVAIKMFTTENAGVFSVLNEKFVPVECEYLLTADTVTGKLISFTVKRIYSYSSNIAFRNSLYDIGATPFEMGIEFCEDYSFSYAGIEIAEDIITLEKGGYANLTVTPFVEEGLSADEYALSFSTYDKFLSVDENGQITAKELYKNPVTVRVTLDYLGKSYSDTCTVYIVDAVESVRISETELTLKRYSDYTLSAEIKPDNATIKDIIWHSSDENIVKTDNIGNITAMNIGTATISAISAQGGIVAKCEVTVVK